MEIVQKKAWFSIFEDKINNKLSNKNKIVEKYWRNLAGRHKNPKKCADKKRKMTEGVLWGPRKKQYFYSIELKNTSIEPAPTLGKSKKEP